jgi:hypothetical protein
MPGADGNRPRGSSLEHGSKSDPCPIEDLGEKQTTLSLGFPITLVFMRMVSIRMKTKVGAKRERPPEPARAISLPPGHAFHGNTGSLSA